MTVVEDMDPLHYWNQVPFMVLGLPVGIDKAGELEKVVEKSVNVL